MKKFQFRLEPVLEQRNAKEQEALVKQSRAEKLYRERLAAKVQAERGLNECLTTSAKCNCRGDHADEQQCISAGAWHQLMYLESLKLKIVQQSQQVQLAEQELQQARQVTVQARQQRMVIEKLKEWQLQEHICQAKALEEKNTDELATGMHNYKQRLEK